MPKRGKYLSKMEKAAVLADIASGLPKTVAAKKYGIGVRTIYGWMGEKPQKEKPPCGTNKAYSRHIRYGEIADKACLQAHAQAQREWKEKRK